MSDFTVFISESAREIFYSLDEDIKKRMNKSFEALKENPFKRRSGADIKKLQGSFNPVFYRIRVGDYRSIYCIINKEVKITKIMLRSKGYKWLE